MSDLELFPDREPASGGEGRPGPGGGDGDDATAPLAARMRPRTLDEFVGQEHILGPGRALRELIEKDEVGSLILWGPPGTGKTTIARVIAERTDAAYVPFSAVTEGIPRVREIIKEAETRLRATGRRTILFCDEIHRFNKAQQDAFLPHVEAGTVSLIGATTENPSFEVIGALLSRARVFVLEPLAEEELAMVLERTLADEERGLGGLDLEVTDGALELMAEQADGDARRALNALETAATLAGADGTVDEDGAREALQRRFAHYDKGGEGHYNLVSALHKAVRGSDPDGALYWLARMLEGGEAPLYIARRLIRMAVEDIGLSDPNALQVAVAARDAFHMLGSPEGDLALAEATVYLATAPKSNRLYAAFGAARAAARDTPAAPVPLHIRNAPTDLMEELGYGKGYRYAFDSEAHFTAQEYLPDALQGTTFYEPSRFGHEKRITERLEWWAERRREAGAQASSGGGGSENPEGAADAAENPQDGGGVGEDS
ncbi:MAG: replication-associated recombination protein A [Longimicrobiales bacterium]